MAVKGRKNSEVYALNEPTLLQIPRPIVANRAPSTRDHAPLGQIWVDKSAESIYMLANITANSANWTTSPASGVGMFTSVDVDPGDLTVVTGDVIISAGDLDVAAGNATFAGDVTVLGLVTFSGDIDFSSAQLIDLTSTLDAAPSILLHANGGTSEQIYLHADQGTAVDSILLGSDAGGITLDAGLATADAINIVASNAGGGIDVNAGTAGIAMDSTGAISLDAAAASNFSVSGAGIDLTLASSAGRIDLVAGEDVAQAIYIRANGGTSESVDIHADQGTGVASVNVHSDVGGITLTAGLATADAINIVASNAGGGIDVDAGTAGIALDSTGAISLDGAAASNFSVSGSGIDLTLASSAGSILVSSGESAALAIYLHANGGTSETIDIHADQGTGVASINVHSDVGGLTFASGLASADAINITASNAAGGIDVDAGTNGFIVDTTGAISLDAAAASNFTATGAFDVTVSSTAGSVLVRGGEAVADAVQVTANNAAGGVAIAAGTGGISLSAAGILTAVDAVDAAASPTASVTINANLGTATFTGFTTASAASETFTVTNSLVVATSAVLATVTNLGSNDAQMTLMRVKQTTGALEFYTTNNGAAALNGNVLISFWIYNQ